MENLWNICGKTDMEKLWKTNTLENYRLKKPKTRYNGVVREPNGRIENATEDYELGN